MTDVQQEKLEQLLGKMVGDMGAAVNGALVMVGERLGLYRTLAERGPTSVSELAEATGELTNLMFEEQGKGVYVYTARGDQAINFDSRLGRRVYLHTTALGKSILSLYPDERVHAILDDVGMPDVTDRTITDRDELFDQLEESPAERPVAPGASCRSQLVPYGDRDEEPPHPVEMLAAAL